MRAQEFIVEASVRDQIVADFKKSGGNIDDYYVRFTDQDKLGYSSRQTFGRSIDVDDPEFDLEYIGTGRGRPALWFYPLSYYLRNKGDLYAVKQPYAWLVKIKPQAWLQDVDNKTKSVEPAPAGKERVGIMRLSSVPAAIFFRPGFDVVGKYYDYAGQHQRHGQVKGRPAPSVMDRLRGVTEAEQTPAQKYIQDVYGQYQDWPYGKGDKVMVWGSGDDQQFAPFALKTDILDKNTVIIDWLQAVPQRQGVGRRAMTELQRQAQEHGVRLKLMPWDKGQVGQGALKRIYKKMGFKPTSKGADLMAWQPEQLDEISDERLQDYLSRARHKIDSRMHRMAQARDRLNKGYEIYYAEEPTKIVHKFDANTPLEAKRYYDDYISQYESDVDYDLRLRRATGIMEEQLDEGLRDWIAALAATGAIAMGSPADAAKAPQPTQSVEQVSQVLAKPAAQVLKKTAIANGITGTELAQFMAQCAHETANFSTLKEIGGTLDFKKYDPRHAPKKAKALGNIKPGDGARYAGRGFIQLTGRDNYKRAGQALGLPLEQKPELVERPDVAAQVAVWFWKNRVAPKVASFHDTRQVTKPINPGMRGIADRQAKFNAIKQGAMATPKDIAPRGRRI